MTANGDGGGKRRPRWAGVIGLALVVGYLLASRTMLLPAYLRMAGPPAPQAAGRDDRWRQDLRYLETQLPRLHVDAFHTVDRETFRRTVDDLGAAVPQMSDLEIMVEVMRIVAMVGDAHTQAVPPSSAPYHAYPFALRWLVDGFYVVEAVPGLEHTVGARVMQIDGTPIDDAVVRLTPYVAHETQTGLWDDMPRSLLCSEMLSVLGIVDDPQSAIFQLEHPDGLRLSQEVRATEAEPYFEGLRSSEPAAILLYRQRPQEHYWYAYLADANTVYLRVSRSIEMDDRPFRDLARSLFAQVDAHPGARLVVDLRENGGGNSELLRPLVRGVLDRPELNREGRLFAIVDRGTYSSAALHAVELDCRTNVLLYGEPPSSVVDHYGQVDSFLLPNSRMRIDYSTKHFPVGRLYAGRLGIGDWLGVLGYASERFPMSRANMGPIEPDVWIGPTIEDYVSGQDPVLAAALAYPQE